MTDRLTEEQAGRIYDVLVNICQAPESMREHFLWHQTHDMIPEWRFSGNLGFGGKFWRNMNQWYVNAYCEDETTERKRTIKKADAALKKLQEELNVF